MNYLTLKPVNEAVELFRGFAALDAERVRVESAVGRVLAEDVASPEAVPAFDRATMDGYAVRARDTHGASESMPAYLKVVGRVPMGAVFGRAIGSEEAAEIGTGGAMPEGADAVVMVEYTRRAGGDVVEVVKAGAAGDSLIRRGEDIAEGGVMLRAGHALRVQDVGALAAVGIREVSVRRRPLVAILSTGNELVATDATPGPGQVRDINSLCLARQVEALGGIATIAGIARDDERELEAKLVKCAESADVVLLSGGSSVGARDLTGTVFEKVGATIVLHGISIAPGKPTILATWHGKPIVGMPGYPVSSMVVFWIFGAALLGALEGRPKAADPMARAFPTRVEGRLVRNVASKPGREDYVRVKVAPNGDVEPILLGTATLSTLMRADGLVRVPRELEGLAAGTAVNVFRF
ncbi:MAG: molybdopterin molybdotransferase MoeA [Deltaproteobacteria bacterium]|nr:molybdopterin molybdotransferase MoeA [Deltaproteobacteria bacterium]